MIVEVDPNLPAGNYGARPEFRDGEFYLVVDTELDYDASPYGVTVS